MAGEPVLATSPAVRERGIIFTGSSVSEILAGTKTQTRRVMKLQAPEDAGSRIIDITYHGSVVTFHYAGKGLEPEGIPCVVRCPYQPGDRLWVREAWCEKERVYDIVTGGGWLPAEPGCEVLYRADRDDDGPWRAPLYMPRWASRLTLEITEVRVERLQEITEADVRAEGITDGGCVNCGEHEPCGCPSPSPDARDAFVWHWNSINGNRGFSFQWEANPWVWAITFKRIEA